MPSSCTEDLDDIVTEAKTRRVVIDAMMSSRRLGIILGKRFAIQELSTFTLPSSQINLNVN